MIMHCELSHFAYCPIVSVTILKEFLKYIVLMELGTHHFNDIIFVSSGIP